MMKIAQNNWSLETYKVVTFESFLGAMSLLALLRIKILVLPSFLPSSLHYPKILTKTQIPFIFKYFSRSQRKQRIPPNNFLPKLILPKIVLLKNPPRNFFPKTFPKKFLSKNSSQNFLPKIPKKFPKDS